MRRKMVALAAVVCVGLSTTAQAVAPELVKAVAEKPLTITLAAGGTKDVHVVSLTDTGFVVVDAQGDVELLNFDEVTSVKVRPQSAPRPAPVAPAPAAPVPAAPARPVTAPAEPQELSFYDQLNVQPEKAPFPRVYARLGVDLSFSSARVHLRDDYEDVEVANRIRALGVGGDFVLGVRVSETIAFHANYGVRRFVAPAERIRVKEDYGATYDTGFSKVDGRYRSMNVGIGVTVLPDPLIVSASIGAAQDPADTWGIGGDVMVGMALPIARTSNAGVALATTWMAKPRDTEGYKHGSYTIGPRIFVAY